MGIMEQYEAWLDSEAEAQKAEAENANNKNKPETGQLYILPPIKKLDCVYGQYAHCMDGTCPNHQCIKHVYASAKPIDIEALAEHIALKISEGFVDCKNTTLEQEALQAIEEFIKGE